MEQMLYTQFQLKGQSICNFFKTGSVKISNFSLELKLVLHLLCITMYLSSIVTKQISAYLSHS